MTIPDGIKIEEQRCNLFLYWAETEKPLDALLLESLTWE
jgi:hypothetical protein